MHNFKPGDLALTLVDQRDWPAGSVVSLYFLCEAGKTYKATNCRFKSEQDEWVCISEHDENGQCYSPHELMPLRGDFKPEEDDLAEYADTSFYDLRTGRQRLVGGRP